jgi:hypothetical protein
MMKHVTLWSLSLIVSLLTFTACGDDDNSKPTGSKLYEVESAWDCDGANCQDVYDFSFVEGSKASFEVTNLTNGSVVQLALYAPGIELGGTNLFTGTTSEIACIIDGDCDLNTGGYSVHDFSITTSGVYRLAVTRNNGFSCGSTGTYDLSVSSDKNFIFKSQTVDNGSPEAPEEPTEECGG